ncbi:putative acid phosphatase [Pseudocercospora fuligena]|uniref:Putative acid phosphatase n=1 Tax=Pseudocercospora fuligena TaxID=685502 RepID=A0A8H6VJ94_9PEZI|nr:putative acid phosphatase [Pseudocercospora fuligena]
MQLHLPSYTTLALSLLVMFTVQTVISAIMKFNQTVPALFTGFATFAGVGNAQSSSNEKAGQTAANATQCGGDVNVSLSWHPPSKYEVNDLAGVINGSGVYGFIFNSSVGPLDTYNWCNMPHTNADTYPKVEEGYKLEYVEVIHRHHKRTPYAANTFPRESYSWECSDEALFYGGEPIGMYGSDSADTYWSVYTSATNPLAPVGFNGTCQFPQITRGGLIDSKKHGKDLKAVYSGMLGFIPEQHDVNVVSYRVTNNVITSQVASMLIPGMYPERENKNAALLIQPDSIDSLEPAYTCSSASALFSSYGSGSSSPAWLQHINASSNLFARLDALSGVNPNASDWHMSWDHYFDNLSARLCHQKPLPCKIGDSADCVSQEEADEVFRLGEYEYSFIYRDSNQSLAASVASYGIWAAELAQNLRHAMGEGPPSTGSATSQSVKYRHNVAHDGSVSRLLSILQIERMVWPGMGSEVVFELYNKQGCYYLRVLWGGQVLQSSHPAFGSMDMVPVNTFLAYIDGLVGRGASKIPGICATPLCEVDGEGCA